MGCLHFSNLALPHPHSLIVHRVRSCVCFGKIFDKTVTAIHCGVVPILGSLASHAHYHGAASRLCVCVLVVCFIAPLDVMVLVALDEHLVQDRRKKATTKANFDRPRRKKPHTFLIAERAVLAIVLCLGCFPSSTSSSHKLEIHFFSHSLTHFFYSSFLKY